MKLIFLNAWGENMRDSLVDFIKDQTQDTDIFCLQEATDEMKHRCQDLFVNYKEISDYKFISDNNNFPQTMFIRNDIKIVSSGTLFQGDMDCGLAVYAQVKVGTDMMYICNVHGMARPNDKLDSPGRLKFSKELVEFFKDKNGPVIIGGDFNLEPGTESIGIFKENGYRDLINECDIKTTRNHFAWDRFPDSKMYYSDYVFLNKKIEDVNFTVLDNEISDHLPLLLEI